LFSEFTGTPEYKAREIFPQSGIYIITHEPAHADMPHQVP
jgi:hypothetical protein